MSVHQSIVKTVRRGIVSYRACNHPGVCYRFETLREARAWMKGYDRA